MYERLLKIGEGKRYISPWKDIDRGNEEKFSDAIDEGNLEEEEGE